ncbi:unnamed protein product [Pleuronectes platessa]|uniref:Uncharacterized protein n=1 Tax=Pleuronectes platessa TaxID=8262 RepID=A0A9N7YAT6_PLEPL|nr:unnamed protein product [Pleuronectes platessa]
MFAQGGVLTCDESCTKMMKLLLEDHSSCCPPVAKELNLKCSVRDGDQRDGDRRDGGRTPEGRRPEGRRPEGRPLYREQRKEKQRCTESVSCHVALTDSHSCCGPKYPRGNRPKQGDEPHSVCEPVLRPPAPHPPLSRPALGR